MFLLMGRLDGEVARSDLFSTIYQSSLAKEHRGLITGKIRGQTGLPEVEANRPSAHLRWALQQMKTRGWTHEQWGQTFTSFTDGGTLGTEPICILESVRAPFDCPGRLRYESIEQHYIRLAFVELGFDPVPLYISEWNDAQRTFEAVENVMVKAIDLAEADERAGRSTLRFSDRDELALRELFGITEAALAAQAHVQAEAEAEADEADRLKVEKLAQLPEALIDITDWFNPEGVTK